MTIELNLAYAIITILLGVSLVFSVIASVFAVRLLERCKIVLDFVVFWGTKDSAGQKEGEDTLTALQNAERFLNREIQRAMEETEPPF